MFARYWKVAFIASRHFLSFISYNMEKAKKASKIQRTTFIFEMICMELHNCDSLFHLLFNGSENWSWCELYSYIFINSMQWLCNFTLKFAFVSIWLKKTKSKIRKFTNEFRWNSIYLLPASVSSCRLNLFTGHYARVSNIYSAVS